MTRIVQNEVKFTKNTLGLHCYIPFFYCKFKVIMNLKIKRNNPFQNIQKKVV